MLHFSLLCEIREHDAKVLELYSETGNIKLGVARVPMAVTPNILHEAVIRHSLRCKHDKNFKVFLLWCKF